MRTGTFNSLARSLITTCIVVAAIVGFVATRDAGAEALALTSNTVDNIDNIGNSFTYQGVLTDNGAPATGLYDFRFQTLNEAMVVFAQVEVADVSVTDGLFTTSVTVGNGVFNGERRFLKVAARKDGESDYVEIGAATKVQAAPYALYAKFAGSATFAEEATFASTLKGGRETVVQVGTFDMAESDGANTLAFAAKGTGALGGHAGGWHGNGLCLCARGHSCGSGGHETKVDNVEFLLQRHCQRRCWCPGWHPRGGRTSLPTTSWR